MTRRPARTFLCPYRKSIKLSDTKPNGKQWNGIQKQIEANPVVDRYGERNEWMNVMSDEELRNPHNSRYNIWWCCCMRVSEECRALINLVRGSWASASEVLQVVLMNDLSVPDSTVQIDLQPYTSTQTPTQTQRNRNWTFNNSESDLKFLRCFSNDRDFLLKKFVRNRQLWSERDCSNISLTHFRDI